PPLTKLLGTESTPFSAGPPDALPRERTLSIIPHAAAPAIPQPIITGVLSCCLS
ncbi:hypothetical protein FBU59_005343, partial [Linderina macrospora]